MPFQQPNRKVPRWRPTIWSIANRRNVVVRLAPIVGYVALVWAVYALQSQSKNVIDRAVLIRQPSEDYANALAPFSRPERPKKEPKVIPTSTNTDAALVKSPGSKTFPQPRDRAVTKTSIPRDDQSSESVVLEFYRTKPVTPSQRVPAQTAAFSVEQVSELEKELNGAALPVKFQ